jgi:hypothetical protein
MENTVKQSQDGQKIQLLEQLRKTPIVELACKKIGIGRATYYRWRKDDSTFLKEADEALDDGASFINEMAESQLISAIQERNLSAIIFWLKHHHNRYATRVEVTAEVKNLNQQLTPEQQKIVDEALRLAALTNGSGQGKEQNNDQSIINP